MRHGVKFRERRDFLRRSAAMPVFERDEPPDAAGKAEANNVSDRLFEETVPAGTEADHAGNDYFSE